MARKKKGWFKNQVKSIYNVKGWMTMGFVGNGTRAVGDLFKTVFSVAPKGETFESFEQAVEYYGLSEADLAAKLKGFKLQVVIYLLVTFLAIAYMIYVFFEKRIFAGIVMIPVTGLAVIKMAQARFYCYQLTHRKLVRSLAMWWGGAAKEEKNEK